MGFHYRNCLTMKHALTRYREAQRMTLEAFAEAVGASKGTVWKWENGEAIPRPVFMRRIMDFTGGRVSANDWVPVTRSESAA